MKAPLVRFACIAAVLAAAGYALITLPGGVAAYRERKREVSSMEKRVGDLAKENQRIQDHIRRLSNDPAEQERVVEERLKYVHPKDKVYYTGTPEKK